ncbi:S-layer homology domain-containing protein [Paenibacillus glycanilyticus]|uniref:S-layer homology domain-containing protein n=1 Tax=Paenibacillus glycanilyticus TaxID=126569 RepID=UPI00204005CC|nr:S-layer homology domain-containing protein [Paenibacillus glycanilyticus]MCM3628712.1 S-layer homology domain-containing protein [Paenibacillus glycanilyticus]
MDFIKLGERSKLFVQWLVIVSLVCGLVQPGIGYASGTEAAGSSSVPTDIQGHWAERTLTDWLGKGYIKGFEDGTVRPDASISRIEFVALANRLFAYKGGADASFKDVPASAWYASDVAAAASEGYVYGFPDGTFRPSKTLTRAEAASMLAKLVPALVREDAEPLSAFKDKGSVPAYGRYALGAALDAGLVTGYPDHTLRPAASMSRAEAVVVLDRILKQSVPNAAGGIVVAAKSLQEAGTYGPETGTLTVAGDLSIDVPGVTLRNVIVKGNLRIGQAVGDGDVYLDSVTVKGTTTISGGGEHSVHIDDAKLGTVIVEKKDGRIRVVVDGSTVIEQLDVRTDARIESNGPESGIAGIAISADGEVALSGKFALVEIKSDVKLIVDTGSIKRLVVNETVGSTKVMLNAGVEVASAELHGTTSVQGTGIIAKALVDAPDVIFETKPLQVEKTERGGKDSGVPIGGGDGGLPNPTVTVSVTANQAGVAGFKLNFNKAVAGLTPTEVTLLTNGGQPVSVGAVATLDGGLSYGVVAALLEGESYTVALAKSGYEFGSAVSFKVPETPPQTIQVAANVTHISAAGFKAVFDQPVINPLFTLKQGGNTVAITDAVTSDNGMSYAIAAILAEDVTYTLTVMKTGYDFGSPKSVYVPVTTPETVPVTASVNGVSETGFTVSLSGAVAGLSAGDFRLTDGLGAPVGLTAATTDGGETYSIAAALTAGGSYTLAITKSGYSFGEALAVVVPGTPDIVVVSPSASNVTTAGFVLSMDQKVPDMEPLSLELKNGDNQSVGVDMLSAVVVGSRYEVWASLDMNETYTLTLNKEGYAFDAPVAIEVVPERIPAAVSQVSHGSFRLKFEAPVSGLTADQLALKDASGQPVAISGLRTEDGGLIWSIEADMSAAGIYTFRADMPDAKYAEVDVVVSETIGIGKYTTINGPYSPQYTGYTVHLDRAVPGLDASHFSLTNASGDPIVPTGVSTTDNGLTYTLQTTEINAGGPFTLGVTAPGYDFGPPAIIVSATLNPWNTRQRPPQFMAGFNPYVPDMTKDNFQVIDESGAEVEVIEVVWDAQMRLYIGKFAGSNGHTYSLSAHADGYDFGAPKMIRVSARNELSAVSATGVTLSLNPPLKLDTSSAFTLKTLDGVKVPINSVTTDDDGSTYRIAANLAGGEYMLSMNADADPNQFYINIPILSRISIGAIASDGITVALDKPNNGLWAGSFQLLHESTGDPVTITSAVTSDGGYSYKLNAGLAGGTYNLKLIGHLPEDGVSFQVADTVDAGSTTISKITNAGFELSFANAIPGLLPVNVDIRDAAGKRLSGVTLATDDNGATYHVRVPLTSNQDYAVTLTKAFAIFQSPVSFHVNRFITGSVTDVTVGGRLILRFSPAFPEIENYLGLVLKDENGQTVYPNGFESFDNGASYRVTVPGGFRPGAAYTYTLELDGFEMKPVAFVAPPSISVASASATGVTVAFADPIAGLLLRNFVVRGPQGEIIAMTSATTNDGGLTYSIAGTLAAGKAYTIQYKPDAASQVNEPVPFVVTKLVTATVSNPTTTGFKLQFNTRIAGLLPGQLILRNPDGSRIAVNQYTLATADQGLTYKVTMSMVEAGDGYTVDLARDDFKLASPVSFNVPATAQTRLLGTQTNLIAVQVFPDMPDLTAANFALVDGTGRSVAITVSYQGGAIYHLKGIFDPNLTYTLKTSVPGYAFGDPIPIAYIVKVDAVVLRQNQSGFTLHLRPAIPGLTASDLHLSDADGNTVAITSAVTSDNGLSYQVQAALTAGKTYTVSTTKAGYLVVTSDPFSLTSKRASIDQVSVHGFKLNFTSPMALLDTDLALTNEQGDPVKATFVSWDGGLTYQVSAELAAGVPYSLSINKMGYDFGAALAFSLQAVVPTFGGTMAGNVNAFTLSFDRPVQGLRPSDFVIMREGWGQPIPVQQATTTDGGSTYLIETTFWGAARYTVLPKKDGYDFGAPVAMDIPVAASAAVLRSGATYMDIGLNPAVPGLDASDFLLKDDNGNRLNATAAVTTDGGATYRVTAGFVGGRTYTVQPVKQGYDFGLKTSVFFPTTIKVQQAGVKAGQLSVKLSPAIGGLPASAFTLRNAGGGLVKIDSVKELNDGLAYALHAGLTEGETYTLKLHADGYDFGTALSVNVPITVGISMADIGAEGFDVTLDQAVSSLIAGNFALTDDRGASITVQSATAVNGGERYHVDAALTEGKTYTLTLERGGYDFGIGRQLFVPVSAAFTLQSANAAGIAIQFQTAVAGLTKSSFVLLDEEGNTVSIRSAATSDDGITYAIAADLADGKSYTLTVAASGYTFGAPIEFDVRTIAVSNVTTSGFKLGLSAAIPNLNPSLVQLKDGNGNVIALDASKFFDENPNSPNKGKSYAVLVPITAGAIYTIEVLDPAHPTTGSSEVVLPIRVQSSVVEANANGITASLSPAQVNLLPADLTIATAEGERIPVLAVVPGAAAGQFILQAPLAEGSTYTLTFAKKGYEFASSITAYVPITVEPAIQSMNESGFTITLNEPVSGLSVKLIDSLGNHVSPVTVTASDEGLSYKVAFNMGYNRDFTLKLSKAGYDFGGDRIVNNVSSVPKLIAATSDESGTKVILTFDKPMKPTDSTSFSVKIDNQWQSNVRSALGSDPTTIVLTWSATGKVIGSTATALVAYAGVNRVQAVNLLFLPTFGETPVTNAATVQGFVLSSAVKDSSAVYPAQVLRGQYGMTALEAIKALREGGFTVASYTRAVYAVYELSKEAIIGLFGEMEADATTMLQGQDAMFDPSYPYYGRDMMAAGYTPSEFGPFLRKHGKTGKQAVVQLKAAGASASDVAAMLRSAYDETAGSGAAILKASGYELEEAAAAVQYAYELSDANAIRALKDAGWQAKEVAAAMKAQLSAGAAAMAEALAEAGYAAAAIGSAVAQAYAFDDADKAVAAFVQAGFSSSDTYGIVRGSFPQSGTAKAMLEAGVSSKEVASAVSEAGDSPAVFIQAMKAVQAEDQLIAVTIKEVWGVTSASEAMKAFDANGYDLAKRAGLLRRAYEADIATAVSALYDGATNEERNNLLRYLVKGGYDPVATTSYFLNNVRGTGRSSVLNQLKQAGLTTSQALKTLHDAIIQGGAAFGLNDALQVLSGDYSTRYTASDAIAGLLEAFAGDSATTIDLNAVSAAVFPARLWDKYEVAGALKSLMGMNLQQWITLERTNAIAGCPCSVTTIRKDAEYLFSGTTLEDLTVAMSLSGQFTLDELIDGTIGAYGYSGAGQALPYLTSALKNAGYAFEDVAESFDRRGWSEWILAFSRYGISASDVAAYLIGKQDTMDQVIRKLSPYSLRDIALVLRENYGLSDLDASTAMIASTGEPSDDIAAAIAWAYGSDPVMLWIQTLRAQGATATSVINTLAARYPAYRTYDALGPALIKGGFSRDEVIQGLIVSFSYGNNLAGTIKLIQSLYAQQQITIAQLLTASGSATPESGIDFLALGGYKLSDIAGSLKEFYGLSSGEAAYALSKKYPNNVSAVLMALSSVYGQTIEMTLGEALDAQGISSASAAVDYLRNAGFGFRDIAAVVKERFARDAGQIAAMYAANHTVDVNAVATTLASLFGQSVESVVHGWLEAQGTTSYSEAITFMNRANFSLASIVKLAKNEYGLSSGAALQALVASGLYPQSNVVGTVASVYGSGQNETIVESLAANGLNTFEQAVPYLKKMYFGLTALVRVGKEHYGLTSGETIAVLNGTTDYSSSEIDAAVQNVYGQTLQQTQLSTLTGLGVATFADAIPQLRSLDFTLRDIVLAAKTYYGLSAGKATYDLLHYGHIDAQDILNEIAELYGQPIDQSLNELLDESGLATIAEAAPFLRSLGYSMQDVIEASKSYYGNGADVTIQALTAVYPDSVSVIEWTVLQQYGEGGQSSAAQAARDSLQAAGITDAEEAITHLWNAGFSFLDIASLLKTDFGKSAADVAKLFLASGSFAPAAIIGGIGTVYGSTYDSSFVETLKTAGALTPDQFASFMNEGGYRAVYIVEALKSSYGKTSAEAKAILMALGQYSAAAVQSTVDQVYGSDATSGTLQEVLDLFGIKTADGAAAFLRQQNAPVKDVVQYLKDAYALGADESTAMLSPHYGKTELGLAVIAVYYGDKNIGYLIKMIPADRMSTPNSAAVYMSDKFSPTDVVLALKVIFGLDALGVTDAIRNEVIPADKVRAAVTEVFGADPLYAFLKRIKDNGGSANDVAAELDRRGVLETAGAGYLIDTLASLGYDNASILKMRYNYYNRSRQNAGTNEEQGTQLVRLGVNTPEAIVAFIRTQSMSPIDTIAIVKAGLPSADMTVIAKAMFNAGYEKRALMGALSFYGEHGDGIAALLKTFGLSVQDALLYLRDRSSDEQLRWLIRDGYSPSEYLRYMNIRSDNTIAILKENGYTAEQLGTLLGNMNTDFYAVADALYHGGFTTVADLSRALIAARSRVVWIPQYLDEIGGWTLQEVAQGMLDSGLISLVELVSALQMANGNNLKNTYQIIKAISGKERQAFYNELSSGEKQLIDDNEVAILMTVATFREAGISITAVALQLRNTEVIGFEDGAKLMGLAGFNVGDILSTIWDVYRDEIGIMIIQKMIEKVIGNYFAEFKNYIKLVKLVSKIVRRYA